MTLAVMLSTDEDSVLCDFAETYHVYNLRALPLLTVATLACGLRAESRIKMALSGQQAMTDTIISAAILDRLSLLVWMNTKDGQKNKNRPESLAEKFTDKKADNYGFASAEEFEKERKRLLGGV